MKNLIEQAIGYLVMEDDIPDLGLRAGDCVFIDDKWYVDDARLIVAEWDGKSHICSLTDFGGIFDYGSHNLAPDDAVPFGRALCVSRNISPAKETAE